MKLQYELKQQDIEESLLCLHWKKEGKKKYINVFIMCMIGAACLARYIQDTKHFFWLILAFMTVILLFCLLYVPSLQRRRRARGMLAQANDKAIYKATVPEKNIRDGFESENVFTIRMDEEVYCIPKRILSKEQREYIRNIFRNGAERNYEITTGRGSWYE